MRLLSLGFLIAALGCGKVSNNSGADGSVDDPDARPDAPPDARALPTDPPVSNGQSAELVLGQPDFIPAPGGLGPNRFADPGGLASDGQRLWVADLRNARVVQFNAQPVVNQPNADLAIGQLDLNSNVMGPDPLHLTPFIGFGDQIGDVSSDGSIVAVADGLSNRAVIWNQLPPANGVDWDVVLGQTTATGATAGTSATQLSGPQGIWTDGDVLLVADTQNHRVLIWNSIATTNGQAADLVLGQSNFTSAEAPDPPTPSSMNLPRDVFFDGERLWVSDSQNNRVMVWLGMPTTDNQSADYFVGQTSGSTRGVNAGGQNANAVGLNVPGQIVVEHGSLFIVDQTNFRVVVHSPRPETSGEEADAVLGAADLDGTGLPDSNQSFRPRGVSVFGDKLFVADSQTATGDTRVLRYGLTNLP